MNQYLFYFITEFVVGIVLAALGMGESLKRFAGMTFLNEMTAQTAT